MMDPHHLQVARRPDGLVDAACCCGQFERLAVSRAEAVEDHDQHVQEDTPDAG